MIVVHPAKLDARGVEEALIFANQLNAAGFEVALSRGLVASDFPASLKYMAVPFARDLDEIVIQTMLVIGGEAADDAASLPLRRLSFAADARVLVFGRFASRQAEIGARNRFTVVTDVVPEIVTLADTAAQAQSQKDSPSFGVDLGLAPLGDTPRVAIIAADVTSDATRPALQALKTARGFSGMIATTGKQKTAWMDKVGPGHPVYQFSEITAPDFSRMADVTVVASNPEANSWVSCVLNNAIVSGRIVVDATPDQVLAGAGIGVIAGPSHLAHLQMYLTDVVLPNLPGLQAEAAEIAQNSLLSLTRFLADLGLVPPKPIKAKKATQSVWFMPTNGVGLGHAQRCALVAEELLSLQSAEQPAKFAAYSSCLPMIRQYGFDVLPLVPASALHHDRFANDLVNYHRLHESTKPGDTFVFDGGYVYDSVMQTVLGRDLRAIWIRRGLWNAGQDNRVPLDREKIFERVIAPLEALDSLNAHLSTGRHVKSVGPIVQRFGGAALKKQVRAALAKRLNRSFETLSVTMLGGGVAADLTMHLQAAAATFETREGHLNLIVNWPGAVINPALYGWRNSKVVASRNAGLLAFASDFMISAAGYNSFHEALYNKIPAIFVPQVAPYMDDQAARAEAAADAGLARFVAADRPRDLSREIAAMLDRGRILELTSALDAAALPPIGNADAAALIAEVAG